MEYLSMLVAVISAVVVCLVYINLKRIHQEFVEYMDRKQLEMSVLHQDIRNLMMQISEPVLKTGQPHEQPPQPDFEEMLLEMMGSSEDSERDEKKEKALKMLEQGLPINEIAKKLQMGTGEVELLANLYKKKI